MVNLYNIHFPASFTELACHPRSRVMHQSPVSRATQFELAQFIKPGPVHKLEFTRRRHLQQTAAAHSWWEGQADVQGKSKGETGESLRAGACQPQWAALHSLLKDRVQLAELAPPVLFGGSPDSHSPTQSNTLAPQEFLLWRISNHWADTNIILKILRIGTKIYIF